MKTWEFLSPGKKAALDQEEHDNKLKQQQKELLRSQELTIQQQEKVLMSQQMTIKLQEKMIEKLQQQQQQPQQEPSKAQEVQCSSSFGVIPGTSGEGNIFP